MADKDFINRTFIQQGPVCAMASYATVIEYFSNGKVKIEDVLDKYVNAHGLSYLSLGKNRFAKKHSEISKHFHEYCIPKDKRGFEFIEQLHKNDTLGTLEYCKISHSNALKNDRVSDEEIEEIRKMIKENDALAIVLYKVNGTNSHAVAIGYDDLNACYLFKDPEKNYVGTEDILSTKEINEYIIFKELKTQGTIYRDLSGL